MGKLAKLRRAIIKDPEKFINTSTNKYTLEYFDKGADIYTILKSGKREHKLGYVSHHVQAHKKFIKSVLKELGYG